MARLKDIAAAAGISESTVSRALRHDPQVAAATVERVEQLARKLGYVPDLGAVRLAHRRGRRLTGRGLTPLALIVQPVRESDAWAWKFHGVAAKAVAAELGYQLYHHNIGAGVTLPALLRRLYHRGVAGVLIDRLSGDLEPFAEADWAPFSVVNLERRLQVPRFDTVRFVVTEGLKACWERCVAAGRRRIGFVLLEHEPAHPDDFGRRVTAEALSRNQPEGPEIPLFRYPQQTASMPSGLPQWLKTHRPDILIGFSPVVLSWLLNLQVRVPDDVAFAALHHSEDYDGPFSCAGLCTVREAAAQAAVRHLDQLMRHGEKGVPPSAIEILINRPWQDGATLPQPPRHL